MSRKEKQVKRFKMKPEYFTFMKLKLCLDGLVIIGLTKERQTGRE